MTSKNLENAIDELNALITDTGYSTEKGVLYGDAAAEFIDTAIGIVERAVGKVHGGLLTDIHHLCDTASVKPNYYKVLACGYDGWRIDFYAQKRRKIESPNVPLGKDEIHCYDNGTWYGLTVAYSMQIVASASDDKCYIQFVNDTDKVRYYSQTIDILRKSVDKVKSRC